MILVFSAALALCGLGAYVFLGEITGLWMAAAGTIPILVVWWLIWASNRPTKDRTHDRS